MTGGGEIEMIDEKGEGGEWGGCKGEETKKRRVVGVIILQ